MPIWGKVFGGFFGLLLTSPLGLGLFGLVAGVFLGHKLDKSIANYSLFFTGLRSSQLQSKTQSVFFEATFSVMGHIAKADGRVSKQQIHAAQSVMAQMKLTPELRRRAIAEFNRGKSNQFNLRETLSALQRVFRHQTVLLHLFVEMQHQSAVADGFLTAEKARLLNTIAAQLGVNMRFSHRPQQRSSHYQHTHSQHHQTHVSPQQELEKAYALLKVNPSASDNDVKLAYRKQMSQHHPDKLVSKGLPEEMIKIATQKTQQIKAAYDLIRKTRGC